MRVEPVDDGLDGRIDREALDRAVNGDAAAGDVLLGAHDVSSPWERRS